MTTSGGRRELHACPSLLGSATEVTESILARVGDPVDMRIGDGTAVRAADLVAAAVARAVRDTGSAAATVACYPSWWTQHTVEVQRSALDAAGLDGVALVPEPTAAMRWLREVHGTEHDGAMAVYDLGATGLTISVVRTGPLSGLLGEPVHSTMVAGTEFDLLAMRYVLANAVGQNDFDPFDPIVEQELAALRGRCRIAKEELSKKTAAVVPVRLPAFGMDVRLVRDELEELLRGPLLGSMDLLREAVRRAGLRVTELDGVLLTGGGAAIPLVTELLSTEFGIPVAAAADPAHISAHGAALLAADLLTDTTATEPHPALVAPTAPVRHATRPGGDGDTTAIPCEPNSGRAGGARSGALPPGAGATAAATGESRGRDAYGDHAAYDEHDMHGAHDMYDEHDTYSAHDTYDEHDEHHPHGAVSSTDAAPAATPRDDEHGPARGRERTAARVTAAPPTLPETAPDPGPRNRKRLAVVSVTALAVAALATGTLAISTGVQSGPSSTPTPGQPSTSIAADPAVSEAGRLEGAPGSPEAPAPTNAPGVPGQPHTPGAPATVQQVATAGTPSPAPGAPAPAPGNAPAQSPAPQPTQPPAPAPQPAPQPTQPTQQPAPQPTQPSVPILPGVIDRVDDTVGSVLDAPKQILPNTGG
ncbi:Hsp70 family protein [Nocardia otitidiscaviarum]|uniref:Hsp70 family protein n=1 Tax=Nocardia otitidiscaviarum TaxID=1823 RepID=UPI0018942402|nr:Hsp70 family protein [Nocardia otitidiscaviarum]MBF6241742.1 Hsp70 family protein [Nocardia otitidiscaviarum]